MTGYQEILTDPSYAGQIVTLTYPHIGNTGVNAEDVGVAARCTPRDWSIRDLPRAALELPRDGRRSARICERTASSASPTSTRAA